MPNIFHVPVTQSHERTYVCTHIRTITRARACSHTRTHTSLYHNINKHTCIQYWNSGHAMRSEAGFNQWAGTTPVTFDIELCVVTGVAYSPLYLKPECARLCRRHGNSERHITIECPSTGSITVQQSDLTRRNVNVSLID